MKKKFAVTLVSFISAFICLFGFAGCGLFGINCSPSTDSGNGGGQNKPEFSAGSGTEADPYIIDSDYQWLNINKYPSACFALSADINMGDYGAISPVGTAQTPFSGKIDGKNYSITGVKIREDYNAGLFGVLSGATVKNLNFTNSSVALLDGYNDGEYAGSFAAIARKGTVIENCHSKNVSVTFPSKTSYFTFIGGFVGSLESVSSAFYCSADVKISLSSGKYPGFYVGGFARMVSGSVIDCCKVTGSITFGNPAGHYVMVVGTIVDRVINSRITNMLAEINASAGYNIDFYSIAGDVDEETLKYCLNFSTYNKAIAGRYRSCKVLSNASKDFNIYFPSSEYDSANSTLDNSIWKDNEFWVKGALHPEFVPYEKYVELKNQSAE